jgi:DNA-binding HxlR family transcriptional regulator
MLKTAATSETGYDRGATGAVVGGGGGGTCSAITQVFELLGKRWSGLIIATLLNGPARFSRLVQLVPGVSERMLSERVSELTAAGLVIREVDDGPPINVRYRLTARGEALRPALAELERWGNEQLVETLGETGTGTGTDCGGADPI